MEILRIIDLIHVALVIDYGAMSHHLEMKEYIEYVGVDITVLGQCTEVCNGIHLNHCDT
ncbi:gp006 [Erwinia phage vB_EamP-S6]|uniref:Gp006 n=1 Tax=Erwinia phage vB_EamP-S6 TaxID=1051675 RepID=G0YQ98_9CAUD|nr:gp006 [Erwinia phage vB_EamP-S6]AEJ81525.1 gp006 [Erwinia phage vB_EamP-S6]